MKMPELVQCIVSQRTPQQPPDPLLTKYITVAYKNIPFFWTNRGYGIFFDHSDALSLEIQTERLGKIQTSIQGEEIRWFVIHGPNPKEVRQDARGF
jgi:alpha-glucosidase (family GH31 glycosyl hydrolase)